MKNQTRPEANKDKDSHIKNEKLKTDLNKIKSDWEEKAINLSSKTLSTQADLEKRIVQLELEKENHQLTLKQKNNELEILEEKEECLKSSNFLVLQKEFDEVNEENLVFNEIISKLEVESNWLDGELLAYDNVNSLLQLVSKWDLNRLSYLMSLINMHIMSSTMKNKYNPLQESQSHIDLNKEDEKKGADPNSHGQILFNMNMFLNTNHK